MLHLISSKKLKQRVRQMLERSRERNFKRGKADRDPDVYNSYRLGYLSCRNDNKGIIISPLADEQLKELEKHMGGRIGGE